MVHETHDNPTLGFSMIQHNELLSTNIIKFIMRNREENLSYSTYPLAIEMLSYLDAIKSSSSVLGNRNCSQRA